MKAKAKWLVLARVQLMGAFGLNKLKYSDDLRAKKRAGGAIALIAFAVILLAFYDVIIALAFAAQGAAGSIPAFAVAIASLVSFIFSLIRGCSMLFAAKDHDAVMSLPVTKAAVIASRLAVSYIVDFAFVLLVCAPAFIVYFVATGFTFYKLIAMLAAVVFSPLLPLAAATAIGTAITALTARFRYKNLLQSLLGILFFIAIFAVSFAVSFGANSQEPDMNALAEAIAGKAYPPAMLVSWAFAGKIWALFAFIGANIAAAAVFIAVTAPFYAKICTRLAAKSAGVAFKEKQIRKSGAFGALFKKEIKRLFSSSVYLMNSIGGALLLLIAAIAMLIFDPIKLLSGLTEEGIPPQAFGYIFGAAGLIFAGMTFPSASSLSMEGKSRWIMCSLPLPAKTILLAKTAVGFVFSAPVALIFSVIVCVQAHAGPLMWAALIAAPVAYCAFISMFGTFLNYKFPKYDWQNEMSAVKNSVPVLILSFGGMVLTMGMLAITLFAGAYGFIPLFVFAALSTAGCAALHAFFFKKVSLYDGAPSAPETKAPKRLY